MAVMAVQVPKVRADRSVTGDVSFIVLFGMPAGSFLEDKVGFATGPEYTRWVGARETYAWIELAIETTEILFVRLALGRLTIANWYAYE